MNIFKPFRSRYLDSSESSPGSSLGPSKEICYHGQDDKHNKEHYLKASEVEERSLGFHHPFQSWERER